jgi:hypothetical protein
MKNLAVAGIVEKFSNIYFDTTYWRAMFVKYVCVFLIVSVFFLRLYQMDL